LQRFDDHRRGCSVQVSQFDGANATTAYLKLNTSVVSKTSSYRPAIFTAADDDTIGEAVTTQTWAPHTGNPQGKYYANPALWVYNISSTLGNMRFSYAQEAIRIEGNQHDIQHHRARSMGQLHSGIVLTGEGSSGTGYPVAINNSLMANVQYPISILHRSIWQYLQLHISSEHSSNRLLRELWELCCGQLGLCQCEQPGAVFAPGQW
jgi:hypothetical protein